MVVNSAKVIDHKDLIGNGKLQMKFWYLIDVKFDSVSP